MNKGQTLLEIIVVIGVIIVLTTGLVALTTVSIQNTRIGVLKSQAVKYAQEGMELVRQRRDSNWTDFKAMNGNWCINDDGTWFKADVCYRNVKFFFGRTANFTWDDVNQRMAVKVTVDWTEGNIFYKTDLNSYFSEGQ